MDGSGPRDTFLSLSVFIFIAFSIVCGIYLLVRVSRSLILLLSCFLFF